MSHPDAWPYVALADLTTRIGSGITPTGGSTVYRLSGRPFVRSQNVGWGVLSLDGIAYIDERTHAGFVGSEIRAGDVLLNITGASIGRSAVATPELDGGNVNQHVCEIRLNRRRMDPAFVSAFLVSRQGQDQIDAFQAGGNRQGLNFQQVGAIRVPAPPLAIQQAVGATAAGADGLSATLEALIAKKQAMKHGMKQQLLTGKTRLPGFSEPWVEVRLSQAGAFLKGRGVRRADVRRSGVPCIRYGEIYTAFTDYTSRTLSFVEPGVAATALPIRPGDLLFAGSGETREEIGKCVAYTGTVRAVAGGDIIVLRGTGFNPVFLASLINTPTIAAQKSRLGQGDAVVHISSRALGDIALRLPSTDEQDAIAAVVTDFDAETRVLRDRLTKANAVKQGMMQQLLTGRTRLPLEVAA